MMINDMELGGMKLPASFPFENIFHWTHRWKVNLVHDHVVDIRWRKPEYVKAVLYRLGRKRARMLCSVKSFFGNGNDAAIRDERYARIMVRQFYP